MQLLFALRCPFCTPTLTCNPHIAAPEDLPAQLLFLHAGQQDLKELHWHTQVELGI